MARIADILTKARKQHFTGRESELAEFQELLTEKCLSSNILFIYGPAGQGKTSLLRELTERCLQAHNLYMYIDGRDVIPSTAGFYEALCDALNVTTTQEVMDVFEKTDRTFVLFIDNYHKLAPLENWLREEFLPQLPESLLTVLCSRNAPSPQWIADPGWQNLIKVMPLRNLSPSESSVYLQKRNVPTEQHQKILDFTHGHPLALSLVADLFIQHPGKDFSPEESQDVIQTLLEHFSLKSPSPAHKTALEICALTYVITESLLASVMELEDASEIFEWLKSLSFIEYNKFGLYPHDLVRESLLADLKWRNPDWFSHLYNKTANYYIRKLEDSSGEEQQKFLFALTYLQRKNPAVRSFYHWEENNEYWVDLMKPDDVKPLAKMVEEFYGTESVKRFKFWLNHPATQVWVWRSPLNPQSGFVMRINTNEIAPDEKINDDIVQNAIDYVNRDFHLRKGEVSTIFRFWMAAGTHQNISKIQSSIFLFITQYYLTTKGLAVHLLTVSNPDYWKVLLNYYGMEHVPSLDYVANNIPRGFYVHDWRKVPPKLWLSSLVRKEKTGTSATSADKLKPEVAVLTEQEFFQSVYSALKDYHHEHKLENNPLLHSKFMRNGSAEDKTDNVVRLKEKLDEALKKLEDSPRYDRLHRLLYRTFINPVGSQEQTAEFLQLPFSTYRRHLKKAVTLVFEHLWKQETSS
ncbi:MAG: AAA family ATPase [Chitinophagales bacterium]|nr:AAA family ATPase [Chitinophagales bacterium]